MPAIRDFGDGRATTEVTQTPIPGSVSVCGSHWTVATIPPPARSFRSVEPRLFSPSRSSIRRARWPDKSTLITSRTKVPAILPDGLPAYAGVASAHRVCHLADAVAWLKLHVFSPKCVFSPPPTLKHAPYFHFEPKPLKSLQHSQPHSPSAPPPSPRHLPHFMHGGTVDRYLAGPVGDWVCTPREISISHKPTKERRRQKSWRGVSDDMPSADTGSCEDGSDWLSPKTSSKEASRNPRQANDDDRLHKVRCIHLLERLLRSLPRPQGYSGPFASRLPTKRAREGSRPDSLLS